MTARWFGWTDRGKVRLINQDGFVGPGIGAFRKESFQRGATWGGEKIPGLWAVSDGMGGHEAGEKASEAALRLLTWEAGRAWSVFRSWDDSAQAADVIRRSIQEIHEKISAMGTLQYLPMGCTLTGVWTPPLGDFAWIFHVGDTRLWQWSSVLGQPSTPALLTQDHNAAWGSRGSAGKNILDSCLGGGMENPRIDVFSVAYRSGDVWLLVSDGLEDGLEASSFLSLCRDNDHDPKRLVRSLVSEALPGSADNVTALSVRWD